jgi:hypothetical protein
MDVGLNWIPEIFTLTILALALSFKFTKNWFKNWVQFHVHIIHSQDWTMYADGSISMAPLGEKKVKSCECAHD